MFPGKLPDNYAKTKKIPQKKRKLLLILEIGTILILTFFTIFVVFFGKKFVFETSIYKLHKDILVFSQKLSTYKYQYRYFPGDDKFAENRFRKFSAIQSGDGSGFIGDNEKVNEEEQAIRHLRASGLMKGDPNEDPLNYPFNPFKGVYKFTSREFEVSGEKYRFNVILVTHVPKDTAEIYDKKFDNGDLKTGVITFEKNKDYKDKNLGDLIIKLNIY